MERRMKPTLDSLELSLLSRKALKSYPHGTLLEITHLPSWRVDICSAYSHPEGLILRRENMFTLNGTSIYRTGSLAQGIAGYRYVYQRPEGILIDTGSGYLLNGKPVDGVNAIQADGIASIQTTHKFRSPCSAISIQDDGTIRFADPSAAAKRQGFTEVDIPKEWINQWEPHNHGALIRREMNRQDHLYILILKDPLEVSD